MLIVSWVECQEGGWLHLPLLLPLQLRLSLPLLLLLRLSLIPPLLPVVVALEILERCQQQQWEQQREQQQVEEEEEEGRCKMMTGKERGRRFRWTRLSLTVVMSLS